MHSTTIVITRMFWPYDAIVCEHVAPLCDVDTSTFDTITEMHAVHAVVKWDGKIRSADAETRLLNQCILARYVEVYRLTGSFPTDVDILTACARESTMREYVEALRLELSICDVIADINTVRPLSSLTDAFFKTRTATYTAIMSRLKYSIIHTDVHRTLFSELVYMHATTATMLSYYYESHKINASFLDVVQSLECMVFYKDALTTRFPYKSAIICYYLQCVPMARWVYDVCELMTWVNRSWNVTGRLTH